MHHEWSCPLSSSRKVSGANPFQAKTLAQVWISCDAFCTAGVISVSADGLVQKPNALLSGFDIAVDKARRCDIVYVVAQLERLAH